MPDMPAPMMRISVSRDIFALYLARNEIRMLGGRVEREVQGFMSPMGQRDRKPLHMMKRGLQFGTPAPNNSIKGSIMSEASDAEDGSN